MRVTSNLFPSTLKSQLNYLQREQQRLQTQIATGLKFTEASDDPAGFASAERTAQRQAQNRAYLDTTEAAIDTGTTNHAALTSLQTLLSRARELTTRAGGINGASELRIIGEEFSSLVDQVVSVMNRQSDGKYLFGGNGNVAPIVTSAAGPPPTYAYNSSGSYSAAVPDVTINIGNTVDTGFVAGRSGGSSFNGVLVSGSSDTLAALQNLRNQLLSGLPIDTSGTDNQALLAGGDRVSEYVGRSAARLSALELNASSLKTMITSGATRLADQTQASYTDSLTDLQRVQLSLEGAMQSGASILKMTLMDYL